MAMMTLDSILAEYPSIALTEAVRLMKVDEPFMLTSRLGRNSFNSPNETCIFEVEEGSYSLAPVSYPGDPATNVNVGRKRTPYTVTPPQIFLKDMITASEIHSVRVAGMNPINMTAQDKNTALNELIGLKLQGVLRLVDRRTEWMFAQALNGKIDYTSETGRVFKFNYNLPAAVDINGEYWNKVTDPGNPIHQLRMLVKHFKATNNQMSPDLIIMGGAAGDAFMNNPHVEGWLKSPGVQLFENKTTLSKGEAVPIGILQGSELFEYSATYENMRGKAIPYIDEDCVYITSSSLWRMYYGAISDFDAGSSALVVGPSFSKMKVSEDGKALYVYVESHPMPVALSSACVVKAKVVD